MEKRIRIPFCGTINLFIETLTGTCFELRVSPFETVLSVKAKIQRLEGIPVSQQHLIWEGTELEDDCCLHDYRIRSNSTVRLVIALRGGPINTRRITVDEPSFLEMADYIDANQDEILEELSIAGARNPGKADGDSQVTLLVYRNGDQVNFFRVIDRGDGAFTPISEPYRTRSLSELVEAEDLVKKPKFSTSRLTENRVTASKMKQLQSQMQLLKLKESSSNNKLQTPNSRIGAQSIRRDQQHSTKPSDEEGSRIPKHLPHKPDAPLSGKPRLPRAVRPKVSFNRHDMYLRSYGLQPLQRQHEDTEELEKSSEATNPNALTPALCGCNGGLQVSLNERNPNALTPALCGCNGGLQVSLNERSALPGTPSLCHHTSDDKSSASAALQAKESKSKVQVETAQCFQSMKTTLDSQLPLISTKTSVLTKNTAGVPDELPYHSLSGKFNSRISQNNLSMERNSGSAAASELASINSTYTKLGTKVLNHCGENLFYSHDREYKISSSKPRTPIAIDASSKNCTLDPVTVGVGGIQMPPCYSRNSSHCSTSLLPPVRPLVIKKKRCLCCGKKTGLATSYTCRCGRNFCATHRYAEAHDCTFDYKSAGRQLLKDSNPLVSAPKLPKI